MKLTNKFNLPEAVVNACKNDDYTRGPSHISITGLSEPPRIRVLTKAFNDIIEEDISDRINLLLGQLMHELLKRANTTALAEQRWYLDIEGITISGESDAVYDNGVIQDYKFVSYFEVQRGVKFEYEAQVNCYKYLVKHGYVLIDGIKTRLPIQDVEVTELEDVYFFKDWTRSKAFQDPEIPQVQCMRMPVKMWTEEETHEYLVTRIRLHKAANKELPECTQEERWAEDDKWAVMPKKNGKRQRAKKLHKTKELAEIHAAQTEGDFVEFRQGYSKRCEFGYCSPGKAGVCKQFNKMKR